MGPIRYFMRQSVGWQRNFWLAQHRVRQTCNKDATRPVRPVTLMGNTNVSNIKEIIESDGRYTIRDIAKAVSISLSRMHFILKCILKVRKISARWISHILTRWHTSKKVTSANVKATPKIFQASMKDNVQTLPLGTKHGFNLNIVSANDKMIYTCRTLRIWTESISWRLVLVVRDIYRCKIGYTDYKSFGRSSTKIDIAFHKWLL